MPPLPWRAKTQPDPGRSYLVMASRLPLRSRRTVPRFLRLTLSVVRQLERTEGLVGYTITRKALVAHDKPSIFVLGPPSVISDKVLDDLGEVGRVTRIGAPTPVENAIEFARYEEGDFGWGATVPGYNFTVAGTSRPLDAAPAATLATRGVFAPLLLTNRADRLPTPLENYFLSVQPGYEGDPGQAVYNRVWILGDDEQVSIAEQAQIDSVTELIPVQAQAP